MIDYRTDPPEVYLDGEDDYRPATKGLPWAEIVAFTVSITLAVTIGTCLGVTGAFAIDRALHPELYAAEITE